MSWWEGVEVAAWHRGWIKEWDPKFPHASFLVGWSRGGDTPGEILKTKNAGDAISGHFEMRLKSQIYLNYAYLQMFQRRKSPFIPCFLRSGALAWSDARTACQTAAGSVLTPGTFFVEIWSWKKKKYDILSLQEGQLSVTGERICTKFL